MADSKTCPKCGAEVPTDAPAGICPKCLMQAGLAGEQSGPAVEPIASMSGFVPPEPEDLAKHFPQLALLHHLAIMKIDKNYLSEDTHL